MLLLLLPAVKNTRIRLKSDKKFAHLVSWFWI